MIIKLKHINTQRTVSSAQQLSDDVQQPYSPGVNAQHGSSSMHVTGSFPGHWWSPTAPTPFVFLMRFFKFKSIVKPKTEEMAEATTSVLRIFILPLSSGLFLASGDLIK